MVAAKDYFGDEPEFRRPSARIVNLCADLEALGAAHFCSMIAEARCQSVVPTAAALINLAVDELWASVLSKINRTLSTKPGMPRTGMRTLALFLGEFGYPELDAIGKQIYAQLPFPLLRVTFAFGPKPVVTRLKPLTLDDLTERDFERLRAALDHFPKEGADAVGRHDAPFRLAILQNPTEALSPSHLPALRKFVQIGRHLDIEVELIWDHDFDRLGEFDALFIRETTAVGHQTYRFADEADRLGLPVIDDPISIRRCTNKVYLAELFRANGVPHPKTWLVCRERLAELEQVLPFPVVLKKPDGAFGIGVERAATPRQFRSIATRMLAQSKLIVAQAFVSTDFDWRIGVLGGKPLFAARYFMCPHHWQILKHAGGCHEEGGTQAVALDDVPPEIIREAVRAANLIGDGLYGVDLKESADGPLVIEINDNPNIEVGMEDAVMGDDLYRAILDRFRLLVGWRFSGRDQRVAALPRRRGRHWFEDAAQVSAE